jgi:hypothetical protein
LLSAVAGSAVSWRRASDELELALIEHGVDSEGVIDVRAAWAAFRVFAQIPFAGLDFRSGGCADGVVVHWGRYYWERFPYNAGFARQLVVRGTAGFAGIRRPMVWWVDLELSLRDSQELTVLADEREPGTGLRFEPVGLLRELALDEIEQFGQVQTVLSARPVLSQIHFYHGDYGDLL